MRFYSTNKKSPIVSLSDAALSGLAPDGGLYMPVELPTVPGKVLTGFGRMSFPEMAYELARATIGDEVPSPALREIVEQAFNFPVRLVRLTEHLSVLELFRGPTWAFKDFGARFMARLMSYFVRGRDRELTVLVATSGDTGSAVALGFLNVPAVRVVVLYPSGQTSEVQEKQFTTLGANITAVEVKGSFDDCQRLVKQAFTDPELREQLFLTSANSINFARLLPQSFYYFYAHAQLDADDRGAVFSVPCGNFGNLTAGLLAKRMGLPVQKFIAATNINDTVPRYFESGVFEPQASRRTISSAMDVGNPSNFARMLELYSHNLEEMRADIWACSHTDSQTMQAIERAHCCYRYLFDPHSAVGWLGIEDYGRQQPLGSQAVVLATAHAAKFAQTVERAVKVKVPLPSSLRELLARKKEAFFLPCGFGQLKAFLLSRRA